VLADHRAAGQLLRCEPALAETPAEARFCAEAAAEAALLPLAGAPALLVTAVAPDGLRLRRVMDKML
jgi:urease accessory protein